MELRTIFAPVAEEMNAVDRALKTLMQNVARQTAAARGSTGITRSDRPAPLRGTGQTDSTGPRAPDRSRGEPRRRTARRRFADRHRLRGGGAARRLTGARRHHRQRRFASSPGQPEQAFRQPRRRPGGRHPVHALLLPHHGPHADRPGEALLPARHLPGHDEGHVHGGNPRAGSGVRATGPSAFPSTWRSPPTRRPCSSPPAAGRPPCSATRGSSSSNASGRSVMHFGLAFQMADDLVDKDHGLDDGGRPEGPHPRIRRTRRGTGIGTLARQRPP